MHLNRTVALVLLLFFILHALIFLLNPLLPFTDLPNHLAEATIFKYQDDSESLIGQYYKGVPAFYPNTFHMAFCALFPSVEVGNKVFHILYIFLLLYSVFVTVRELGGNLWYSILSVFFIYNFNTGWGFTGFAIAIPVTILLFYLTLKEIRKGGIKYTIISSILLILLYLMHAQVALFGLVLYGFMNLFAHWGRWKRLFTNLILATLPVIILVVYWWTHRAAEVKEESTAAFLAMYYKDHFFQEFHRRGYLFVYDQQHLLGGKKGLLLAGFLTMLLFIPLLFARAWKNVPVRNFFRDQKFLYPAIFLLVSAGCYFILPNALPGQGPLHERFCTLVFLSGIIAASVLLVNFRVRWMPAYIIIACLVYSALWGEYIFSFNRENRDFKPEFFSNIPPEKKLGGLMYDYQYRGREVYIHFPGYYLVWNKGLATSKIIDFRFGVVRRGEKGAEIPFYNEWVGRDYADQNYDSSLHYLLQRGNAPMQPDSNVVNFQMVRQAGAFRLFKNQSLP